MFRLCAPCARAHCPSALAVNLRRRPPSPGCRSGRATRARRRSSAPPQQAAARRQTPTATGHLEATARRSQEQGGGRQRQRRLVPSPSPCARVRLPQGTRLHSSGASARLRSPTTTLGRTKTPIFCRQTGAPRLRLARLARRIRCVLVCVRARARAPICACWRHKATSAHTHSRAPPQTRARPPPARSRAEPTNWTTTGPPGSPTTPPPSARTRSPINYSINCCLLISKAC